MFGKLFGDSKKPLPQQGPPSLSANVRDTIMSTIGSRGIPPMPAAAQKAFQLSVDPNAEPRDFIAVIESDEALSARIIKIANSVFFDRGKSSKSIEEAVTVIGLNELRSLLNATTLSELFPSSHPMRPVLWANDIATALISRDLTVQFFPGKEELAFLAGLMHDIGKLLLLQRVREDYEKVIRLVETQGKSFSLAEGEIFPFDHTEVGQLIAEKWNFSPELTDIIRNHHGSWEDVCHGHKPTSLTAIIKIADTIAHALGLGHPPSLGRLHKLAEQELSMVFELLSVPTGEQKSFLARFKQTFDHEYDLYSA